MSWDKTVRELLRKYDETRGAMPCDPTLTLRVDVLRDTLGAYDEAIHERDVANCRYLDERNRAGAMERIISNELVALATDLDALFGEELARERFVQLAAKWASAPAPLPAASPDVEALRQLAERLVGDDRTVPVTYGALRSMFALLAETRSVLSREQTFRHFAEAFHAAAAKQRDVERETAERLRRDLLGCTCEKRH